MAVITYKCPNCGGDLRFDPATQRYKCEYCGSDFSQEELEQMNPAEGQEQKAEDFAQTGERKPDGSQSADGIERDSAGEEAVVYSCPSCGAEIVTDATTAATFCYYCHNPVVLSGRLSGEYLPDQIIPFLIDKESAVEQFMTYVKKKKFVPKAFFNEDQIEKLSGVYYPYWIYDCQTEGRVCGEATKVQTWQTGDTEYVKTRYFHVEREGQVKLKNITKNALKKADNVLAEGVLPYRLKEKQPFSMGYLSGFLAEKRDIEKKSLEPEVRDEVKDYAQRILRDSINGYHSVTLDSKQVDMEKENWSYLLLPVWVLTYASRGGSVYYYTMNGQTGKICGKLPVDYGRLIAFAGIVSVIVMFVLLWIAYMI